MEKGTHKGLYRSIQKTLKFFQTFALLEVSFQWCLFLYHIYLKICLLEQNQSYFAYYLLPIDSLKTSGDRDLFYAIDMWFFLFVCLLTDSPLFNWWVFFKIDFYVWQRLHLGQWLTCFSFVGIVPTSVLVAGVQVSSRIFMVWLVTHSIKPVSDMTLCLLEPAGKLSY